MKKYILLSMLPGLLMTSCIDTSVLPDDQVTGENFWQDKEDVTSMVTDVYKAMCAEGAVERFVVWGSFRSDEMAPCAATFSSAKLTALKDIKNGVMTSTNTYADWASIYSIINRCNVVLEKAPGVVAIDPAYTQETYYTDESQMLGIRALCYFYLVRAFRDVPYTETAIMASSQDMKVVQYSPAYVLDRCINDLNRALLHSLSPTAYSDWRSVGLLNRDGLKAILADVYLWRASMTHNMEDYSKCAELCKEIIDSKTSQGLSFSGGFGGGMMGDGNTSTLDYLLLSGKYAYSSIFSSGNSSESIFELQMDGTNSGNLGLMHLYWNYDDKNRASGLVKASIGLFGSAGENAAYLNETDYRYVDNLFDAENSLTEISIRKMVGLNENKDRMKREKYQSRGNAGTVALGQNHIFYRLTDIMLMRAEALVQLGDAASLTEAFNLVYAVNTRSQEDATLCLTDANYKTQDALEKLVLEERLRELCFEGKRWFDLVRYNYRHVEGIRPELMLWEIAGDNASKEAFVQNYNEMMTLVSRGYLENGSTITSKMNREAYLYFPVLNSEMKVNENLHQNPVYSSNDNYVKN